MTEEARVVVMARPESGAIDMVARRLPAVGPDEAKVRIRAAGICGTDLHIVRWNAWAAATYRPPTALGHEFCGEVVEVGAAVAHLRPGDRVVAETHLYCGQCRQCRLNRRHTCENLKTFSRLDRGALADAAVVPAQLLRRVPDGVPDRLASLMEPLGIAARAATVADLRGADVLVTGCGPIGLLAIAAARHFGAHRIVATDRVPERLKIARALGADEAIDVSAASPHERIASLGGRRDVDVAIDASGSAKAIAEALSLVTAGGKLILTGLPEQAVPLDLSRHVILREVSVHGVYGRLIDETWLLTEQLIASKRFDLDPILTHTFPLEEFRAAFDVALQGRCGKVVFQLP